MTNEAISPETKAARAQLLTRLASIGLPECIAQIERAHIGRTWAETRSVGIYGGQTVESMRSRLAHCEKNRARLIAKWSGVSVGSMSAARHPWWMM